MYPSSSMVGSELRARQGGRAQSDRENFSQLTMNSSERAPEGTPPLSPSDSSAFEKWRRKAALVTGLGVTEQERMRAVEEFQTKTCEKWKLNLMHYSQFGASQIPPADVSPGSPCLALWCLDLTRPGCRIYAQASQTCWV